MKCLTCSYIFFRSEAQFMKKNQSVEVEYGVQNYFVVFAYLRILSTLNLIKISGDYQN